MVNNKKDGIAIITEKCKVPYKLSNDVLTLFFGDQIVCSEEVINYIVGMTSNTATPKYTYYHLSVPLKCSINKSEVEIHYPLLCGNVNVYVDYFIDDYYEKALYNGMTFSFMELDCFAPSDEIYVKDEQKFMFLKNPIKLCEFDFTHKNKKVSFTLQVRSCADVIVNGVDPIKNKLESKSELILRFEKTNDLLFILELYRAIQKLFAFICNRKNITLDSAVLTSEKTKQDFQSLQNTSDNKSKKSLKHHRLVIIDKYKDIPENKSNCIKIAKYSMMSSHFEELFNMFLEDKVSTLSIHNSLKARNHVDLQQFLSITSLFEYYQRNFLPEISSKTILEVYNEVDNLLEDYLKKVTGEKRRIAKRLKKSLRPRISLKEIIIKVYNGYDDWTGLENILDGFFTYNIDDLAKAANEWRNALAHHKKECEPDVKIVHAIRLLEHLNYCIVLRVAGYEDNEIKNIVENILTR